MTSDGETAAAGVAEDVPFAPIEQLRAHEYVAEQLRHHIGLGLIPFGTSLPPERDLARMFGVGRSTIQSALRLLEAENLIESRRGRGGGTFVIEPSRDKATEERMLLDVRLAAEEIDDALRFRRIVEEGAAAEAAAHATAEDLANLRAISDRMAACTDEFEFHRLDTDFHVTLARASHSDLLREAVERSRLALNQALLAQPGSDAWHSRINGEHERIIKAVGDKNPKRAVRAMDVHLQRTESGIRSLIATMS
ncbi:MAG: FadR family transcriptional regulator [Actinobacteria bacterium]|nr:FadR family transcriptional regulator [Actinomycetota bacterium]